MNASDQEPKVTESATKICPYPPCKYSKSGDALRKHVARHHMDVVETFGAFRAYAVPDFNGDKPVLRCLKCQKFCANKESFLNQHLLQMKCIWFATEEGLVEVAALTKDEKFGTAASAFLRAFSDVSGDVSFSSSVSSGKFAKEVKKIMSRVRVVWHLSEITSLIEHMIMTIGPTTTRPSLVPSDLGLLSIMGSKDY
ncbi:hypothetical protein BG011_000895 [Mortierella polycephala]|uniref:Uncharacterized protein n=1 Tax=Mortierella polycephala TaxID=41804 RepID=A0A9P6PJT0_9FUNG|nr:hypothetical protein BG011_000895 [Mortierella polycephala]